MHEGIPPDGAVRLQLREEEYESARLRQRGNERPWLCPQVLETRVVGRSELEREGTVRTTRKESTNTTQEENCMSAGGYTGA